MASSVSLWVVKEISPAARARADRPMVETTDMVSAVAA